MTDLISRSAALKAAESIDWYHINQNGRLVSGSTSDDVSYVKFDDAISMLKNAPAIDAVPVVRCKDCWKRGGYHCPMFYEELWSYDEDSSKWIEHDKTVDNGFCHRGERREQNESE
jgi:hypothetical protein